MTPKEALKKIKVSIATYLNKVTKLGIERHLENLENDTCLDVVSKALNELEALKKPPTVDELCKSLSEQLKQKVSYGAKQFYYTIENTKCVMFVTETYGDGLWSINEYLPPHLITLIGRFYEGLEVIE